MEEYFKKIKKEINKTAMTRGEKDAMLQKIFAGESVSPAAPVPSPYTSFVRNFYKYGVAALLLIFVGGSSITVAARSLPGDLLYPIKVNFNEPIKSALIVDKEARVSWQAEKVERRLKEIEVLAERGDIDEKRSEIIEKKLEESLDDYGLAIEDAEKNASPRKSAKKSDEEEPKNMAMESDDMAVNRMEESTSTDLGANEQVSLKMKIHQDEVEPSGPESELDIKSEAHQRAIKAIKEGKGEDAKNKIKTLETSVREKIEKKKKEIELERKRRNLERESSERSKAGRE